MVKRKKSHGFTLIELMITVAVIGILGAIAFPSYMESVRKSRRAEGRTAMMEVLQQQERYMTQNNTYLAFADTTTDKPFKNFSGDKRTGAAYHIGSRACSGDIKLCVQVFGTPKYTDPKVTELTITSTGIKSCTGGDTSVCWK